MKLFPAFIEFARSKPAHETFNRYDPEDCAIAQFAKHHFADDPDVVVKFASSGGFYAFHRVIPFHFLTIDILDKSETWGELADRLASAEGQRAFILRRTE